MIFILNSHIVAAIKPHLAVSAFGLTRMSCYLQSILLMFKPRLNLTIIRKTQYILSSVSPDRV